MKCPRTHRRPGALSYIRTGRSYHGKFARRSAGKAVFVRGIGGIDVFLGYDN